jgi:(p)ppGpp synthase/HD superfamily hydrolase
VEAAGVTARLRAEAMARRLTRTAHALAIDREGQDLIRRAFEIGMEPRFDRGLQDHDPDYLHPARTALILMDDAGVADPQTLAAALVAETRDPSLVPDPEALGALADVLSILHAVPGPGSEPEGLMEQLVTATRAVRLVAIAERLDHARHLHLRERSEWEGYHAVTCRVYAPAAARTQHTLAGRLAWWCTTFEQRFLTP